MTLSHIHSGYTSLEQAVHTALEGYKKSDFWFLQYGLELKGLT